jgi:hypothetical protein
MKTHQSTLALRFRTFMTHRELDRQILAGCDPRESPELALRVSQLTDPHARRELAQSIRRALRYSERETAPSPMSAVMIQRPAVKHGRSALMDLADQLELAARVTPRGMVLAHEFIRDGFSPIYDAYATRTVTEVAREIQDALAVWQPAEAIAA